nr:MAG: internal scaffolding protein [Microvirus sp.]
MTKKTEATKARPGRPHAQDFSEAKCGRITDSSFAPACDVNNIVKHYESTGLDPFLERKKLASGGDASTTSYESAMRAKAELDSAFHNLTPQERAQHENSPLAWYEYLASERSSQAVHDALATPPDVADAPPPEDSPISNEGD